MVNNETNNRRAKNRKAFAQILEEYETRKFRSYMCAVDVSKDATATGNASQPSLSDFFCDVENTIMEVLKDKTLFDKFMNVYLLAEDSFSKSKDNYYQQRVGELFIRRNIYPSSKYFRTVRKRIRPE